MIKPSLIFVFCLFSAFKGIGQTTTILKAAQFKHYIDRFNDQDEELYPNKITNSEAWDFLKTNIPLLDCPDTIIAQTYYFRWWTYRKHIVQTKDGYIISEFLPDVPWAGKDNGISCAAALHFYEGRWLHNSTYLNSYADYWFHRGGSPRSYSFWAADALYNDYKVTGKDSLCKALLGNLVLNFEAWEKEKKSANGLFWQVDDRDGMEMSICGTGYRPTINAYMYGDAVAIAKIAQIAGKEKIAAQYLQKAHTLKALVQELLWDKPANFFKMMPLNTDTRCATRELNGYTPWFFNLPDSKYLTAWKYLMQPKYFYAPFGPTTAEQCSPKFKISYKGHECQWNGPSWPFSTSITLTALANVLNQKSQKFIQKEDYFNLLSIYAHSQQRVNEAGKTVPWIDEDLNPFTGDWIARTRLKTWKNGTWDATKGGKERGKDYNHSTFCDLVISGLIGLRPQAGNRLTVHPLLPKDKWTYFCLDNVLYHNKIVCIVYDKTGKRYGLGKGFMLFVDGKKVASSAQIGRLSVSL